VGGTNPSLLEAMASNALICAHHNSFNKYILEKDAIYFETSEDVTSCLKISKSDDQYQRMLQNNTNKIIEVYSWDRIAKSYAQHLLDVKGKFGKKSF
jgi:glycosyltransferase involved in cell wall biosynthesis